MQEGSWQPPNQLRSKPDRSITNEDMRQDPSSAHIHKACDATLELWSKHVGEFRFGMVMPFVPRVNAQ